jgi:hypothetical protein
MLALFLTLLACASAAQIPDPFVSTSHWEATESWGKNPLTYTLEPQGTFKSSDWDNGRGQGTWTHAGKTFVMIWPQYRGVLYQGSIEGEEIRGTAYNQDGSIMGTFVFRLVR